MIKQHTIFVNDYIKVLKNRVFAIGHDKMRFTRPGDIFEVKGFDKNILNKYAVIIENGCVIPLEDVEYFEMREPQVGEYVRSDLEKEAELFQMLNGKWEKIPRETILQVKQIVEHKPERAVIVEGDGVANLLLLMREVKLVRVSIDIEIKTLQKCVCTGQTLLMSGCICGFLKKEKRV